MNLKRIFLLLALIVAPPLALGGFVQPAPVTVDVDSNSAFGDMVSARFSDNDVEFIGCGVRYFDDGAGFAFVFAFCQATDADENSVFCSTQNPGLVEAIHNISDFSFITFSGNDDGECLSIGNSTQSFYIPDSLEPDDDDDDDEDDDD